MAEAYKPFNIFDDDIPLRGRCLIEASAGTGKTYNITGMVVRLVAENVLGAGKDISKILVVTYTKAATQELKNRIVQRLRKCYTVLQTHDTGDDPFLQQFLERYQDKPATEGNLERAIRQIDELSVFTIHGFAQRMLQKYAPQAGLNFSGEIITDPDELTSELVTDYWRQKVSRAGQSIKERAVLVTLRNISGTPKKFNDDYGSFITEPAVNLSGGFDISMWEEQINSTQEIFGNLQETLTSDVIADFLELYSGKYNLGAGTFKKDNRADVDGALEYFKEPDYFFEADSEPMKHLKYLGYERIEEKFNKGFTYEQLPVSAATVNWMKSFDNLLNDIETFNETKSEILEAALATLQNRYESELKEREAFTYDDLLKMADYIVQNYPAIRQNLREEHPISLIDEFQDTDPLQWSLFSTVYDTEESIAEQSLLYLIGDPKQSIYKFRGADINAYLRARESIAPDRRYTLGTNYRSDEGFVKALNYLWGRHDKPFYDEEIPYQQVVSKHGDRSPLSGSLAPTHWIVDDSDEAELNKYSALERAAAITAAHIDRVLTIDRGYEGFEPKDIAVLCRTNKQAALVKEALFEKGLNSVLLNRESIYKSDEATELHILLKAVAECSNLSNLRAALGTRIMAEEELLLKLRSDDSADDHIQQSWDRRVRQFQEYHETWENSGFSSMMRRLLAESNAYHHLLTYNDGERRVTNLNHLMQLLQEYARERPGEMHYLLHKLQSHISDAGKSQSEEEELRLESDRELIKIATIHRSKGLDYNVVYCPFLWQGINASTLKNKLPFIYQDPDNAAQKRFELLGERYDDSPFRYFEEEFADQLRVTYVALTRGVHHNVFIHVPFKTNYKPGGKSSYSALDYILLGHERYQKALHKKFADYVPAEETEWITYNELISTIKKFSENSDGLIGFEVWDDSGTTENQQDRDSATEEQALELKPFNQRNRLYPAWSLGSYSSLTRDENEWDDLAEQASEKMDDEAVPDQEPAPEEDIQPHPQSIFAFPKGAQTGLCWHNIFELMPFHQPGIWRDIIKEQLSTHGFDTERWLKPLQKRIERCMHLSLSDAGGLTLRSLDPNKVRKEMAFHFGFDRADAASLLSIIRNNHGEPEQTGSNGSSLRGFMKGFIDLTFRHNGKVYMLDYKSNHLGNRFEDYHQSALENSILESRYDLQYHIYTLALHRYLKQRIGPAYSYKKHFGGVFYLYLRGIQDQDDSTGIFYDRPGASTIHQLNEYLNQFRGNHE